MTSFLQIALTSTLLIPCPITGARAATAERPPGCTLLDTCFEEPSSLLPKTLSGPQKASSLPRASNANQSRSSGAAPAPATGDLKLASTAGTQTASTAPLSQNSPPASRTVFPVYFPPGSATPPPLNRIGYQAFGTLRLRAEDYNWFPSTQGNGAYTFLGGFMRAGISRATRTEDVVVEFAAPFLIGLPTQATAPAPEGALGQGANYRDANHNQAAGFFLKQGYVRFKNAGNPANTVRLGRFEFSDGVETTSADTSLNWIEQNRIAQRLIGPSVYTDVSRSFDGIQAVNNTRLRNITAGVFLPTRGIVDLNGWDTLIDIKLAYLAATYPQPGPRASGEGRLFALAYNDSRNSAVVKVDNRPLMSAQGLPARTGDTGDITIVTLGGNYTRVEPLGDGKVDGMFWGAAQIGRWGNLRHGAFAFAAEAGYQPNVPSLKPWLRVGYNYFSGDGSNSNAIHGTFTAPEYTARLYARFPFFNEANLKDGFVQLLLRPTPRLAIRADVHDLRLADSHDLWYGGNGAYEVRNFGFSGRPSNGHSNLATFYDISIDYQAWRALTLSLYFGYAKGGDVIKSIYRGGDATFGYAEATYHF